MGFRGSGHWAISTEYARGSLSAPINIVLLLRPVEQLQDSKLVQETGEFLVSVWVRDP